MLEEVFVIEKDSDRNDMKKNHVCEKRVQVCLFLCAVKRAEHLELMTYLTLQTLMYALRRMIVTKGRLHDSDNTSTFTCAANLVTEDPTQANWLSSKDIERKFSPGPPPLGVGFGRERCAHTWK